MRGAVVRLAALVSGLALAPAWAQEAPVTPPSAGDVAVPTGEVALKSPLLTLDRARMFSETLYGKAVDARFKTQSDALIAENLRLEQALEAEERDLTERRSALPAAEFQTLAAAFDAKAEGIRSAQETKSRNISAKRESEQQLFLEAAIPVLGDLMRDSGAAAIFDKDMIILSLRGIDITDAAIARIDSVLGSGDAPVAPGAPAVLP